ncbi:MAG: pyridoxal-dependent decarboxylase [Ornithinimicrobium sp.]|uniref:pyridoxal phosphate-dependent decarboxylase family protein n=1 Tax=Ornithinimicrobium sp. TaxID=1977084 RepID=UPI0026DF7FBF|nr:pyridoxal-dependent decarboxylase [Ornithinimicrobium sp.]MDO5741180.1 pyridoxal-dependent decarboxylase [Ornithinimicrobium sp.]
MARLAAYLTDDAPTHGGRVLSYVYDSGRPELDALAGAAAAAVQAVNGLDPTTFPSVARLESDLVRFAREMLHGPTATGSVTSGGTESCLLAVLAAREQWRRRHAAGAQPGTVRPLIVLPASAHAAFHKAAHLFDLDLILVPVDAATGVPSVAEMVEAMDAAGDALALVVVSAPSYPHGVLDPIVEVAAAARTRDLPCHVDACIGGWVLPWWGAAGGDPLPPWDFAVPGVTSISADLHKYGFAPKGASLLLFSDPALDRARYFALTDWPGYPVVNPTLLGSRSATSLAAAWAVVQALGPGGYVELTRPTVRATAAVRAAVESIDGLRILGEPVGPLLAVAADLDTSGAVRADAVDPHAWATAVARAGFVLQGQPAFGLIPRSTHLTITPVTERVLAELIPVLIAAADEVRGAPERAEAAGAIPDPAQLAAAARAGGELDLASVLALIEMLPREQSAGLLTAFLAEFVAPPAGSDGQSTGVEV